MNKGEIFVQEFVIGLGLLGGIGVDPEGEILKTLIQAALPNFPGFFIFIISIILTIGAVIGAFAMGGWVGIIAVILAFFGGLFINHGFAGYLIVGAILIGLIAPSTKE